jgi:class 3 adenylate cyclase/tetratricopeptide (TPR) repeat protein
MRRLVSSARAGRESVGVNETGAHRQAEADSRKVVTVLFADITGSTGLGQTLDPEALQQMMSRYFAEMKLVVERHGGLVSKFIGDAVMAVFGLPRVHEDDALRAVRAAAEMREALAALNEEFASSWGITVAVRTGVNTGQVLAREPNDQQALVVGDAVNVAARLEQVAEPDEILIGEDTYHLVHDAVRAEPAGPLELRGIASGVPAWRLVAVLADAPGWNRRLDSPMVDRERELARLEDAFHRVADTGTCELATVMAPAGVGKSRLTAELLSRLRSRATVLQGRCLPYGEGITFWPIVPVLRGAVGIQERDSERETRRKIRELLADDADDNEVVCDALAPLLGRGSPSAGIQEIYWAVRKLLEHVGSDGPLIVVFDDIHWGEATFLDLVEYLGDWITSSPVLLLCQARPELLDVRPGWMTAKPNASLVTLGPLNAAETKSLIRGLVGDVDLPTEAGSRIAGVAEGNPLFVEETVRMLVDDGVLQRQSHGWALTGDLSRITIPATIHALLTARLDRLEPEERSAVERGSVIGRAFWWGAVSDLSPPEMRPRIGACLQSLVRKQLIEPYRSELRQQDSFRFTHILVRDAAYEAIPKARRAELHEQVAEWIEAKTRDLPGEYEEIVGYHFEQAHRALVELGPGTDRTAQLAERAAVPLTSAGQRALARGDMPAAVNLLSRATRLMPAHDARRLELLPDVAFALMETADFERRAGGAPPKDGAAAAASDGRLQAHATVIGLWIRFFTSPDGWADEAEREARRAIATFGRIGDERGLARAWSLLGVVHCMYARFAPAEQAWSSAVEHARRAGNRRDLLEALSWLPGMIEAGPTPAEDGIRRCREILDQAQGDKKVMSIALFSEAGLLAGLGRFDEAMDLFRRARALLEEVALPAWIAGPLAQDVGWAQLLAADPAGAEHVLRDAFDTLTEVGEVSFLSTIAGLLAEAIYVQGRYEEAERFTRVGEDSAGAEDVYSQALWRSVRAKCRAKQGDVTQALDLAHDAGALVETTDSPHLRWHVWVGQAEVLRLAGDTARAETSLHRAIDAAERKQNLVGARLAREALEALYAERPQPRTM